MKRKTIKELTVIREESYFRQDLVLCGNCKWWWGYSGGMNGNCTMLELRGRRIHKDIHYTGICDLWESIKGGAK